MTFIQTTLCDFVRKGKYTLNLICKKKINRVDMFSVKKNENTTFSDVLITDDFIADMKIT